MSTKSRTARTYEDLRRRILSGQHLPRARLRIDLLSDALEVTPGAVREALARLTSDGLVVASPHRGFMVAPVSARDLIELTQVRIEIECRCLRRAIELGDIEWETQVTAAHYRLSRTSIAEPSTGGLLSRDWATAHTLFHDALVTPCDHGWWMRLREQLFMQAERYRAIHRPFAETKRDVDAEHEALMDSLLSRDADRACAEMTQHLQTTADYLLSSGIFDDGHAGENPQPER